MGHLKTEVAYRMLAYETESGVREHIWNSRDGVVPTKIHEASTGDEALLLQTEAAPYMPDHVPNVGDRIFVDMTETRARAIASGIIDNAETIFDPQLLAEMQERFPSREAAFEDLVGAILRRTPVDLVDVTAGYREELLLARKVAAQMPLEGFPIFESEDDYEQAVEVAPFVAARVIDLSEAMQFFDRQGQRISWEQFLKYRQDQDYCRLAITPISDDLVISTVWTGMVSGSVGGNNPKIFETAVLTRKEDGRSFRAYSTEADAFRGHSETVKQYRGRVVDN